jgi:hypothetical protein
MEQLNEVTDVLRRQEGKCIWLICTVLMEKMAKLTVVTLSPSV